ncbi:MAG: class I SAM-dependent methyltransferase [Candidatus Nitrosocaldaceae archaeon]
MGLGKEYWRQVISALKEIIPVYDKVNSIISLGKANRLRELGIKLLLEGYYKPLLLDAGSGYGNLSRIVMNESRDAKIIMLDPIREMLRVSDLNLDKVSSIFEALPFSNYTFDLVMCGYSFRDSIDYSKAIEEFARVLKDEGRLVIIDLGKPDNNIYRLGAAFYLRFIMPIFAFIIAGNIGLRFREIYGTYKRLPKNSEMKRLLSRRFRYVKIHTMLFGAAVIFIAEK